MAAIALSLVVLLVGLFVSSRLHHRLGPLALGAMSAATVLIALRRFDAFAAAVATTTLLAACFWNLLLNRRAVEISRRR